MEPAKSQWQAFLVSSDFEKVTTTEPFKVRHPFSSSKIGVQLRIYKL